MERFYIDVQLRYGKVMLQVDEVPTEEWEMSYTPQFIIDFHNGKEFTTITLRMEQGKWYDKNTRLPEEEFHQHYFDSDEKARDPDYQSPLLPGEIEEIGKAIARHMIIFLSAYMNMFLPSFPDPKVN